MLQERKTKNANCVDLHTETVALLRVHRDRCSTLAEGRGVPIEKCPLFATATDMTRSWASNWVTKRFAVALDQPGVEHFRLHDYADSRVMPISGVKLLVA